MPNILPYGTQFSPNQIDLPRLLQLVSENEGTETAPLIDAIVTAFFSDKAERERRSIAGNCKNSLVAYGIMETGGGVHFTEFGRQLHSISEEADRNSFEHPIEDEQKRVCFLTYKCRKCGKIVTRDED